MRYEKLIHFIDLFEPRTICEIGTWNGDNAIRMIRAAQKHHSAITYVGYDLFEDATSETDEKEFNVKPHASLHEVQSHIESMTGANVTLIKGDTNDTLTDGVFDFVFIDGGHSLATIEVRRDRV